jgi:tetrapyrrole methylase family protein/MazG family protein
MQKNNEHFFSELIALCNTLRAENGCMWDKEQTHETLIPYLKEESEEVIHAIRAGDKENLKEELGDLLYQVIFHAQIASENNEFTIYDVIDGIVKKLIRRHPHVFGDTKVSSIEDILENWKKIKDKEKGNK